MQEIPQQIRDLINQVVEQDEGGWVLTSNPNDPDGGWTFGGAIAEHWIKYFEKNTLHLPTFEQKTFIRVLIENDIKNQAVQIWIDRGIEIYYTEFYQQLLKTVCAEKGLYPVEFSCAINIGPANAYQLHLKAIQACGQNEDEPGDYEKHFCKAWIDHYVELVKKNAEAWALYATVDRASAQSKKPATLRAEFLHGWINRVWKYLP